MTNAELLMKLGNNEFLARRLDRDQTSVCRWKRAGIPPELWHHVVKLAEQSGVRITIEQLEAGHPKWGSKQRRLRAAGKPRHRLKAGPLPSGRRRGEKENRHGSQPRGGAEPERPA